MLAPGHRPSRRPCDRGSGLDFGWGCSSLSVAIIGVGESQTRTADTSRPHIILLQATMIFIRPVTQAFFRQTANSCIIATATRGVTRHATVSNTPALPFSVPGGTSSSATRRGFADATGTGSPWGNFTMAPPDPIIGLTEVCDFIFIRIIYCLRVLRTHSLYRHT